MNLASRSLRPYWNLVGLHDLALLVTRQGVLWKFRAAGQEGDRALDARLEAGELVITRSNLDPEDSVQVRIHDRVVDFTCVRKAESSLRTVSLPGDLALNESCSTTSRRDGVVEVRVPLALASAADRPVADRAAEPAVLVPSRAA